MYTHISRDERAVIASGLRLGHSYQTIADDLGRNKGAVWREVHANKDAGGVYRAWSADRSARARRAASKVDARYLETHTEVACVVEALLDPLVSPQVIAHLIGIHHQTIYDWIERSRPDLKQRLPQRAHKRRRYGSKRGTKQGWTRQTRSITERTEGVQNWEGDTIVGTGRGRILTHVERASLYTRADVMEDGTADRVHAALKQEPLCGTITYDRGSEFALWRMIERDMNATVYFAHPHHPWQRGKNENTNGRLRRVFPKRYNLGTITQTELDAVVDLMNHTPRRTLGWRTPAEVFSERCSSG
jgi:IS30 family transposase